MAKGREKQKGLMHRWVLLSVEIRRGGIDARIQPRCLQPSRMGIKDQIGCTLPPTELGRGGAERQRES